MNLFSELRNLTQYHKKSYLLFLILVIGFFIYDIGKDIVEYEAWSWHFMFELSIFVLATYLLYSSIVEQRKLTREVEQKAHTINQLSGELGTYIESQFKDWALTTTEKEVGWLLLKGLTFAEMARLRGVKEKTLRQHAAHLYAKAQINGRNELSAFFIEDLLSTRA